MQNKQVVVDTTNSDGKAVKLAVIRPTNRINQDANMAYNLKMAFLIRNGSKNNANRLLLRAELEEYLQEIGVWSVQDALDVEKLALQIRANELMLKKGGIKLSEGRTLAIQMAEKRQLIMERHARRQQFDSATVESHAENFRFEFMLVKCLVFADTGLPFLKDHESYVDRQDEMAVVDGAKILANMVYGLDDNIEQNMFEMQWLKDAGMIDKEGKYVRPDGTKTDRDGRLVNGDGRYIDAGGQMIDTLGRQVDEKGNLLVDISKPFIDDDSGEDVVVCAIGAKKKVPKKVKQRKTKRKKKLVVKKT